MPLYVVNSQMDNLDLDAFVLPYNSSLEKYYANSYFKKHSLLEFLEKAQKNNISEENVLKKNQVVYYIKNSNDEIPAILTGCKLPEQSKDYQYNSSDEPKDFKERLLKEEKRILSSFYFAEEKIILASFYRKILKTALLNNFYNISIPIIISNIAQSQQYIDLARKTVRNFINNSFDEITVYLQLTDFDNDYFTDKLNYLNEIYHLVPVIHYP